MREHRPQRHGEPLPDRSEAREDHVHRSARRSAALRSRLERIQQLEVHGLAQPIAPVHEPFAKRPADALHPHAAQAGDFVADLNIKSAAGTVPAASLLVARLALEQKVRLLTAADSWTLYAEEDLGLRPLVLSYSPAV